MPKKISLALSSGGSRGLAHIGVIEEIVSRGHSIKSIAGSSMGAFVGGLYSAGTMEKYKRWVLDLDKLDIFNLIDLTFSSNGFIKGDKLFHEMLRLGFIPEVDIEDLPIPIAIIASEIMHSKEMVFTRGRLFDALRASVSIPNVITPIEEPNIILVDGGVLNPLPINRIPKAAKDLIIAVDVNAMIRYEKPVLPQKKKKEIEKERGAIDQLKEKWSSFFNENQKTKVFKKNELGYFEIFNRSLQVMQNRITQLTIEKTPPDLLIEISRDASGTFDFYKAEELIAAGRQACKKVLDKAGI